MAHRPAGLNADSAAVAAASHVGLIQVLTTAILRIGQLARDADPETAPTLGAVERDLVEAGRQLRELMERLDPEAPA